MFCKHCGNEVPDDSGFCPKCGKDVSAAPTEKAPVEEKPVVETPPKTVKKTVTPQQKKGGSGGKIVIVLIVGIVIFIGVGVGYKVPYTYYENKDVSVPYEAQESYTEQEPFQTKKDLTYKVLSATDRSCGSLSI